MQRKLLLYECKNYTEELPTKVERQSFHGQFASKIICNVDVLDMCRR